MGVAAQFARVYEWTLLSRVKTDSHQKLKNLQVKSVQSALSHISQYRVKTDSHQKLKNLQVKSVQSALSHISIDLCSA